MGPIGELIPEAPVSNTVKSNLIHLHGHLDNLSLAYLQTVIDWEKGYDAAANRWGSIRYGERLLREEGNRPDPATLGQIASPLQMKDFLNFKNKSWDAAPRDMKGLLESIYGTQAPQTWGLLQHALSLASVWDSDFTTRLLNLEAMKVEHHSNSWIANREHWKNVSGLLTMIRLQPNLSVQELLEEAPSPVQVATMMGDLPNMKYHPKDMSPEPKPAMTGEHCSRCKTRVEDDPEDVLCDHLGRVFCEDCEDLRKQAVDRTIGMLNDSYPRHPTFEDLTPDWVDDLQLIFGKGNARAAYVHMCRVPYPLLASADRRSVRGTPRFPPEPAHRKTEGASIKVNVMEVSSSRSQSEKDVWMDP